MRCKGPAARDVSGTPGAPIEMPLVAANRYERVRSRVPEFASSHPTILTGT